MSPWLWLFAKSTISLKWIKLILVFFLLNLSVVLEINVHRNTDRYTRENYSIYVSSSFQPQIIDQFFSINKDKYRVFIFIHVTLHGESNRITSRDQLNGIGLRVIQTLSPIHVQCRSRHVASKRHAVDATRVTRPRYVMWRMSPRDIK